MTMTTFNCSPADCYTIHKLAFHFLIKETVFGKEHIDLKKLHLLYGQLIEPTLPWLRFQFKPLELVNYIYSNLFVINVTFHPSLVDALYGLRLVNYSLLGLLYPRWCSASPTADKRE